MKLNLNSAVFVRPDFFARWPDDDGGLSAWTTGLGVIRLGRITTESGTQVNELWYVNSTPEPAVLVVYSPTAAKWVTDVITYPLPVSDSLMCSFTENFPPGPKLRQ